MFLYAPAWKPKIDKKITEMKTYNKLAPKVKTLFRFEKTKSGNNVAPSGNTTNTATTTTISSIAFNIN
jgi:hypothetical protein